MLRALASSDAAHSGARAAAVATLETTKSLRNARQAHLAAAIATGEEQHPMGVEHALIPHAAANAGHLNRLVYDCKNRTRLPGTVVRREGAAATKDVTVNECYDGFGSTFKLYYDIFHRDSIDAAGLNLLGSVHYDSEYSNAFWNGRQMVFGDGDGFYFNRFTASLDVIGHELTHGVVQFTCKLEYQDQAGALNEHLADVFGTLVKQYALNQKAAEADWLIGQGLFTKNVHGVALRSMKAPGTAYDDPAIGKDPQPGSYKDYVATTEDNGGVHINSGIPNRAFYIVAVALGGCAWEKAGQIWYATMTDKRLTSNADFKLFAGLTVDNALKLFGKNIRNIVASSWGEVGIPIVAPPVRGKL
jgi:Zn-dependent metalloprotease